MEIKFIKSQKGVNQLLYNSFLYQKDRQHNEKTYWKCVEYLTFKCKGRCHTVDNQVEKEIGEHNHVPKVAVIKAKELYSEIKESSKTSTETPLQIIAAATSTSSQAVCSKLPKIDSIK